MGLPAHDAAASGRDRLSPAGRDARMSPVTAAGEPTLTFSRLSPSILNAADRLRVARQILAVLEHHFHSSGLGERRVLDIGCSSGVITSFLADVSGLAVGIDVD